ncbi:MAG TPA: protein-glutamate O-methyltransferase CheR [Patescibacteria group bacterium]|nr:protein-glutamate O-methyltransferase CheR [Patescibacteria group bacterium]
MTKHSNDDAFDVSDLIWFVQSRCGIDLSRYRPSCIRRRVSHRLSMLGCPSLESYASYLNEHPDEVEELLNVVTIHVTGFFRDRDVYNALTETIFPEIIQKKRSAHDRFIRIWSAGCSTGEETYSSTIALIHLLREQKDDYRVEVYGTDISEESCRTARRGRYAGDRVTGIPRTMLKQYFEIDGSGYRVAPEIKHHVKFAVHDLFSESPFSMLDLIICRNVLIHFEHEVRGHVLANFHRSLSDDGFLVLGKSEAMSGPALGLFELVEPRSKIYRKRVLCVCSREE